MINLLSTKAPIEFSRKRISFHKTLEKLDIHWKQKKGTLTFTLQNEIDMDHSFKMKI